MISTMSHATAPITSSMPSHSICKDINAFMPPSRNHTVNADAPWDVKPTLEFSGLNLYATQKATSKESSSRGHNLP